ncbi:O-antigen ligase family protein [Vibrio coralliilyticus]|uniref:O-antigen ligase family protein n=1 Tax=Vibrio coralliilyticus TaxID=190893 RepID=UPI001804C4F8|nr:O-antigen ligase family protein [Vibrio coralliilyticus]NUW68986.1 O-antigen ligase family protein [Vibrio coralliilyticus]
MKNLVQQLEKAFLFSPIFLVLISIFNFTDTKSLVSRIAVIVIAYSIIRYKQCIKSNFDQYNYKKFFLASILIFTYFSIMHFWRGDNFGLPRTLITCLVYLSVVPWGKFSKEWFYNTVVLSAYICGFNAIYEHYYLNMIRVGMAINPIPYALYCSFLSLSSLALVRCYKSIPMQCVCILGFLFALWALILTDSRGVWIAYPIVALFVIYKVFNSFSYTKLSVLTLIGLGVAYFSFQPIIDERIGLTLYELKSIGQGNFDTSIGVRLQLWQFGVENWVEKPVLGLGDIMLEEGIGKIPARGAYHQPHLHNQFLDTLSRYGVVGMLVVLYWLCYPMIFIKNTDYGTIISCSLAMLILIAGLSDVPLHHTHIVYLFTLVVGVGALLKQGNQS